ncbi:MAG: DegT/DnrJ/EryC1/StrS family aminotransferase [Bacteriovorax sp.]|jgi:dTDP-4-amino-4,6-dideoxygalactose transaminase
MWKIPLFDLNYDHAERNAVLEVLESKWLSSGEKTKEFETQFSNYLGKEVYSTAVSNCTAALHMSLMIADVKEGDEVIIPSLTFVADANVVKIMKATPILCDVASNEDWNMDIAHLETLITPKTKAVIAVHYAGYPIETIKELVVLCKKHNLILIEDVAHAIGGSYDGQKCGTFGDMSCFSFFSNKNLSTGEGGMFVTKNPHFYEQAKLLRSHGMTSMTIDRHQGKTISYDVIQPGLNYRGDEIKSALGLVQLSKLDHANKLRSELVEHYQQKLAAVVPGITVPFKKISKASVSSYHIFPVMLPVGADRPKIMEKLKEKGIQASIHYPAMKDFSYYSKVLKNEVKKANEISSRVITLPLYPTLKKEQIDVVVDVLASALG